MSGPTDVEHLAPSPAAPERAGSERAGSEQASSEQASSEQASSEQRVTVTDGPGVTAPAPDRLARVIEALLLVVDEPVALDGLAAAVGTPVDLVRGALEELSQEYDAAERGLEIRVVAGGYRLYTREAYAPWVEHFLLEGQQARLTQAALETLAIVAYRQPITRSRVSAVRGVNVDAVMRTLVSRGLVEEAGTESETGAIRYRTTGYFLERLGLGTLDDLPPLAPFLPDIEALNDEEN